MFWNGSTAIDGLSRQRQRLGRHAHRGRAPARRRSRRCRRSAVASAAARQPSVDVADEAEAALVQRADQRLLVAVVADRAPRRADARIQRRVGDQPSLPHRVEQLVLADDPVAMPHQIGEHVEHLRLDRHGRAGVPQLLPHQIDLVRAEAEYQTGPRSQKTTGRPACRGTANIDRRWPRQPQNTTIGNLKEISRKIMTGCSRRSSGRFRASLDSTQRRNDAPPIQQSAERAAQPRAAVL